MDLYPSPAEERPTKKRPAHRIRHGIAKAETVSCLAYWTQYFIGGPRQQRQKRQLAAPMGRGKSWELAQRDVDPSLGYSFPYRIPKGDTSKTAI